MPFKLESWGVVARVSHMLANMVVARIGVAGGGVGCVSGCANVEEEVSGGHCARSRDQDASVAAHSVPFVVGECMEGWGWGVIFLIGVVAGVFHKCRRGCLDSTACVVDDRWWVVVCDGVSWVRVSDIRDVVACARSHGVGGRWLYGRGGLR